MITNFDELDNICQNDNSLGRHYKPKNYLTKYKFSINMMLDAFCTDYLVYTYEDYYYDDFNENMVKEYQPHINYGEFIILKKDLDSIIELEKRSELLIEIIEKNIEPSSIISWKYEKIDDYLCDLFVKIKDKSSELNNILITDYIDLLKKNKYSIVKKCYSEEESLLTTESIIKKAREIIKSFPSYEYSSILPL